MFGSGVKYFFLWLFDDEYYIFILLYILGIYLICLLFDNVCGCGIILVFEGYLMVVYFIGVNVYVLRFSFVVLLC